ncbi:MAG: putative short chain dehydrogenase [Actinomycetia bacterium]|nr:putative short chain dehydrogenase [Actinomycetes bacterium]
MNDLDGKVAIVTGAGRGIGRAEALTLAALGARVVVNDVGVSRFGEGGDDGPAHAVVEEIRATGGAAVANTARIGGWDEARGLVGQAVDTYGRLDIVVNNAGVTRERMSFNAEESDWDVVIDVHLKGTYSLCRFAGEHWRDESKASGDPVHAAIVNTASVNGLNGGMPGQINYAAAKAGVATMTIAFARELSPYGVRVNAIAPIAFTRMTEPLWGDDLFTEERRNEMSPEGVAAVVAWLASPRADAVNGQILGVHGAECFIWESWRPTNRVRTDGGPWTIEQLDATADDLFAGRDRGIPTAPH